MNGWNHSNNTSESTHKNNHVNIGKFLHTPATSSFPSDSVQQNRSNHPSVEDSHIEIDTRDFSRLQSAYRDQMNPPGESRHFPSEVTGISDNYPVPQSQVPHGTINRNAVVHGSRNNTSHVTNLPFSNSAFSGNGRSGPSPHGSRNPSPSPASVQRTSNHLQSPSPASVQRTSNHLHIEGIRRTHNVHTGDERGRSHPQPQDPTRQSFNTQLGNTQLGLGPQPSNNQLINDLLRQTPQIHYTNGTLRNTQHVSMADQSYHSQTIQLSSGPVTSHQKSPMSSAPPGLTEFSNVDSSIPGMQDVLGPMPIYTEESPNLRIPKRSDPTYLSTPAQEIRYHQLPPRLAPQTSLPMVSKYPLSGSNAGTVSPAEPIQSVPYMCQDAPAVTRHQLIRHESPTGEHWGTYQVGGRGTMAPGGGPVHHNQNACLPGCIAPCDAVDPLNAPVTVCATEEKDVPVPVVGVQISPRYSVVQPGQRQDVYFADDVRSVMYHQQNPPELPRHKYCGCDEIDNQHPSATAQAGRRVQESPDDRRLLFRGDPALQKHATSERLRAPPRAENILCSKCGGNKRLGGPDQHVQFKSEEEPPITAQIPSYSSISPPSVSLTKPLDPNKIAPPRMNDAPLHVRNHPGPITLAPQTSVQQYNDIGIRIPPGQIPVQSCTAPFCSCKSIPTSISGMRGHRPCLHVPQTQEIVIPAHVVEAPLPCIRQPEAEVHEFSTQPQRVETVVQHDMHNATGPVPQPRNGPQWGLEFESVQPHVQEVPAANQSHCGGCNIPYKLNLPARPNPLPEPKGIDPNGIDSQPSQHLPFPSYASNCPPTIGSSRSIQENMISSRPPNQQTTATVMEYVSNHAVPHIMEEEIIQAFDPLSASNTPDLSRHGNLRIRSRFDRKEDGRPPLKPDSMYTTFQPKDKTEKPWKPTELVEAFRPRGMESINDADPVGRRVLMRSESPSARRAKKISQEALRQITPSAPSLFRQVSPHVEQSVGGRSPSSKFTTSPRSKKDSHIAPVKHSRSYQAEIVDGESPINYLFNHNQQSNTQINQQSNTQIGESPMSNLYNHNQQLNTQFLSHNVPQNSMLEAGVTQIEYRNPDRNPDYKSNLEIIKDNDECSVESSGGNMRAISHKTHSTTLTSTTARLTQVNNMVGKIQQMEDILISGTAENTPAYSTPPGDSGRYAHQPGHTMFSKSVQDGDDNTVWTQTPKSQSVSYRNAMPEIVDSHHSPTESIVKDAGFSFQKESVSSIAASRRRLNSRPDSGPQNLTDTQRRKRSEQRSSGPGLPLTRGQFHDGTKMSGRTDYSSGSIIPAWDVASSVNHLPVEVELARSVAKRKSIPHPSEHSLQSPWHSEEIERRHGITNSKWKPRDPSALVDDNPWGTQYISQDRSNYSHDPSAIHDDYQLYFQQERNYYSMASIEPKITDSHNQPEIKDRTYQSRSTEDRIADSIITHEKTRNTNKINMSSHSSSLLKSNSIQNSHESHTKMELSVLEKQQFTGEVKIKGDSYSDLPSMDSTTFPQASNNWRVPDEQNLSVFEDVPWNPDIVNDKNFIVDDLLTEPSNN